LSDQEIVARLFRHRGEKVAPEPLRSGAR
jgi:hypothetical protein